jgi:cytoskeletal protein CcmA (bactofilin family)
MDQNSTTPPVEGSPPEEPNDSSSLEVPEDDSNSLDTQSNVTDATGGNKGDEFAPLPSKKEKGIKGIFKKFNVYLLLFLLILIVAGGVIMISYFQSARARPTTVSTQSLTQSDLNQIADSDASVGNPKQVLNIESNAVFAGAVLVRDGLEVAGNLQVTGAASLQSLNVTGQTTLAQVQISKDLSVNGNLAIQGTETISQNLQVNGTGTFAGALAAPQITTSLLQLNGDLTLDHHLVAGGPTPAGQDGSALGSGGTASVGGSDTSGTVSVNTGGGPVAGCFIAVTFTNPFEEVPQILLTPVGVNAAGIPYYITHTTTGFSICDAGAPPADVSFGFDYFVIG